MARAFISLGSDIEPEKNIRRALDALAARAEVAAVSTVYATEPVGRTGGPRFYNCVVEIRTGLEPADLKYRMLRPIESELSRLRSSDKNAPRTIDLDLLLYDDRVIVSQGLVLPDPDIRTRAFLAVPLSELAHDVVYPGTGTTIARIAAGLKQDGLSPLPGYTAALRGSLREKAAL